MRGEFESGKRISKKKQVMTRLRQAILSGAIKGGDQIAELSLAQEFGVGHGVIREALIELEHQGLVQRTPFTGTTVTELTLEDVQDIFEVRIELEPLAFALAAKNARESDTSVLSEIVEKSKLQATGEDLDGFFEGYLEFSRKVWEVSGNRYLQPALERIVVPLFALHRIQRQHNREGIFQTVLECLEYQEGVLDALRRNESESARQIAREFLVRTKENLETRLVRETPRTYRRK